MKFVVTITLVLIGSLFWKILFVRGSAIGLYWLFFGYDKGVVPIAGLALLALGFSFIRFIVQIIGGNGDWRTQLKLTGALFGLVFVSLLSILALFGSSTVHVTSTQVLGRVYYLAAYPMFDINYGLYECDRFGILCKSVFHSGDYMPLHPLNATLKYDPAARSLSVEVEDEGTIYVYSIKQE